jgi:hypothetical protein
MLPFFESSYTNLPNHRIAGVFFDCKTELFAQTDNLSRSVHSISPGEKRARYLLDIGAGPGKLNRAGAWLVEKERMRLKAAIGT